ncbi:MAG: DUF4278 domain-containing protein [Leptolyngbya sp. SIO1D8]|nr:DUF4278 domain-containing protein [Leptolyngbya sp. SIO1D8]
MELKYRGVSYQTDISGDQAAPNEQIGTSRGGSNQTKSRKSPLRQPGEELIYRGVRYTR